MPLPEGPQRGQRANPGSRQNQPAGQTQGAMFSRIRFSGQIDPELFNSIAKDAAEKVARASKDRNKSTQLRRFYEELCLWDQRVTQQPVTQQPEKFSEYLPFIR